MVHNNIQIVVTGFYSFVNIILFDHLIGHLWIKLNKQKSHYKFVNIMVFGHFGYFGYFGHPDYILKQILQYKTKVHA